MIAPAAAIIEEMGAGIADVNREVARADGAARLRVPSEAPMIRFLAYWLTTAVALGVVAWILPGVSITSLPALAVSALVLGMVNAVVRPILVVLTAPLTILTLGVFYLVVNGVAFSLAAWLVAGFEVRSFGWAVLGAILVGVVSLFIGAWDRRGNV